MLSFTETGVDRVTLARAHYYSPARFHAIFVREVGQSPGAFLRDKQLERACAALHNTRQNVLDIALAAGFESPQGFNRAFKRKFGITPSEYRARAYLAPFLRIAKTTTERGFSKMYYTPPSFSDADRKHCLPVIDRLLQCADTARKHGILSLEDMLAHEPHFMLRKGLFLICDGVHPDLVRDILTTLLQAEHYVGAALLERMMIIEGVLSVQAGELPFILEEKLTAMLGETFLQSELFRRWCGTDRYARAAAYYDKPIAAAPQNAGLYACRAVAHRMGNNHAAAVADWAKWYNAARIAGTNALFSPEWLARIETSRAPALPESEGAFEALRALSDSDMQSLLRSVGTQDLAVALKVGSEELKAKFFGNMSERTTEIVREEMRCMGPVSRTEVTEKQQNIVAQWAVQRELGKFATAGTG